MPIYAPSRSPNIVTFHRNRSSVPLEEAQERVSLRRARYTRHLGRLAPFNGPYKLLVNLYGVTWTQRFQRVIGTLNRDAFLHHFESIGHDFAPFWLELKELFSSWKLFKRRHLADNFIIWITRNRHSLLFIDSWVRLFSTHYCHFPPEIFDGYNDPLCWEDVDAYPLN